MPDKLPINAYCAKLALEARDIVIERQNERAKEPPKKYAPPPDAKLADVPWRGIFKVGEEMAELQVELSKLSAFPTGIYPDLKRSNLLVGVIEEATDLKAALDYFLESNGITINATRYAAKRAKFATWGLTGVVADTSTAEA